MITLKPGDTAPDFNLSNQEGKNVKLSDFKEKKVILYFYPKDGTPGCTKEACDFRDNIKKLKSSNIEVLGVSNDYEKSHQRFIGKFNLPFQLLCDVDKKVSKQYGVYELKNFMGKEYYGIVRSTFIINESGKIEKIFYKVNPDGHVNGILDAIKNKEKG